MERRCKLTRKMASGTWRFASGLCQRLAELVVVSLNEPLKRFGVWPAGAAVSRSLEDRGH